MIKTHTLLASVAVLACAIAYGLSLGGPLFFDDLPNVVDNELVKISGTTFDGWRVAVLSSDAGLSYRPVSMLSFALNHVLFGDFSALSLKGGNLVIHVAIGWLVYIFSLQALRAPLLARSEALGERQLIAALAASLWLLHPVHVSTVLYAVQRMAQLSTLFSVAGLVLFMRYRLRWATSGASAGEVMAAALWLLLLTLLATLAKENGALLPLLVVVAEVTLFAGTWQARELTRLAWLGRAALLLPVLILALLLLFLPEVFSGLYSGREFSLEERLFTQLRVGWRYLYWLVLPNVMDMGFFHDDIALSAGLLKPVTTILSLFAWLALLGAALLWRRRYPLFAFAVGFFLAAQLMESSVLPLEMVFEHRNYLPSLGVCLVLAFMLVRGAQKVDWMSQGLAVVLVLLVLFTQLLWRTQAWQDEQSLARFNVINHPDSPRANFFYANALYKRFQRAQELGLTEDEQRALAVNSRRYFERMQQLDGRDVAAPVMLYRLDSRYFPGLLQNTDWLAVLEELLATRVLQRSDTSALNALADMAIAGSGEVDEVRIRAIIDDLAQRYPWNMQVLASKFRLTLALDDEDRSAMLPALERSLRYSTSPQAAAYLAQYYGGQDVGGTYDALGQWMRRDRIRREIDRITEIFENE